MARKQWTYSIRLGVVSIFVFATVLTACVAIGLQYYFNYQQALETAKAQYQATAEQAASELEKLDLRASDVARTLTRQLPLITDTGQINRNTARWFADVLALNPAFYALYIGHDNGDFFELINLEADPQARERLKAHADERWVIMSIRQRQDARQQSYRYLNDKLVTLRQRDVFAAYDPRTRPWYRGANSKRVFKTPVYLFNNNLSGKTYSLRLPGGDAVLGLDVALSSFTRTLVNMPVANGTELYLYDNNGALLASNQPRHQAGPLPSVTPLTLSDDEQALVSKLGPLRVSNELDWPPLDFAIAGQPSGYTIDTLKLISQMTGLQFRFINGENWTGLMALFQQGKIDLLQPVLPSRDNRQRGQLTEPLIQLPFALASRADQDPYTSLSQLQGKTLAVGENWSIIPAIRDSYPTIKLREYASTLDAMKAVVRGDADAVVDNTIVLQYCRHQFFLQALQISQSDTIGLPDSQGSLSLMVHDDQPALLALLNRAIARIPADARQQLAQKWLLDPQSLNRLTATLPYPPLLNPDTREGNLGQFNQDDVQHFFYTRSLGERGAMNFAAVISQPMITGAAADNALLAAGITALCMIILLPFAWLFANPIVRPIKQLEAQSHHVRERRYDRVSRVPTRITETEKLADSLYQMAQAIGQHEKQLEALMEAFIELIAEAIDGKSPYTGTHCARVPILGMMLGDAASLSSDGPFRDFSLDDDKKRREFRIAAWLHDCGKITTPEHIVDKGAKLETIYNRIHEIRTRFEVLWRDAQIDYLTACQANPHQQDELRQRWQQRQQQLQEDFAFIAAANQGSETMSEADKNRVREIGAHTWQRHFDDRLGLSPLQSRQLGPSTTELPVTETLLQDKPEHLLAHEHTTEYDPRLGIRMQAPEWRANLGEVYNLTIERGTLTPEDRFKINEHIINTIRMLDSLPFPEDLAKVPQYASTHHERLDGKGYPRQLTAEQLEIPDRILAVADVFEALTAADRPYKDAKTLSESLAIMKAMVADGHIDGQVFALFLRSGVCLRYAQHYLSESQIDVQDLDAYLPSSPGYS
ncbi:metal dependent phosphohydrolase [Alcanivorax hongdengensis A-11-3]|uniref:Metal dependent phosphohydrolase n=1 Tax=Alcanivorax hongdengensis A-11-3 TaxID=1177179 RepID=L0W9U1_9GAMM|nr:HD domain-containing phosphohydrolase [Alcanivorax hongdengensis]EKF73513.1 metal dependent phosphohydrolase [Alcanivorax hongdengensis A-11-3]